MHFSTRQNAWEYQPFDTVTHTQTKYDQSIKHRRWGADISFFLRAIKPLDPHTTIAQQGQGYNAATTQQPRQQWLGSIDRYSQG